MDFTLSIKPLVPLVLGIVGILIVIGIGSLILSRLEGELKPKYNYRKKEYFLTRSESAFYKALVEAVADSYFIFPQAHLPTIVDEKISGQNWRAARSHINRKSVDFVLCDKETTTPLLAIEYDDISHEREDRQLRDVEVVRILKQAGVSLLRVKTSEHGTIAELRQKIEDSINTKSA